MKLVYLGDSLKHHGIKGQKWGDKNGPPYPLNSKDHSASEKEAGWRKSLHKSDYTYGKESNKSPTINRDGIVSFPKGFVLNRVGKNSLDINQSGALYASYGKQDAARYVKSLGPTLIGKLLGTAGESIQHLEVKTPITMPSNEIVANETLRLLKSNKRLMKSFDDSFYSMVVEDSNYEKSPLKTAYAVSSMLGDSNYASESKMIYEHFRKLGYDALPDLHDTMSGTAETSMIIINPDKVSIQSTTTITKDVMKESKRFVKSLAKLKVNDLLS